MQYRTETQLRQELEDVWQMYHATKRGAQAAIEAAVAAERERLCAAIKAADDKASEGDYMLDSGDCISVIRGTWTPWA